MFREGEAWRPPAARTAADLFAESVEPAAEPIEFVILADLVRPLVEITVQCDLMPVLLQKVDLRRVFLNDPAGHEEGQVQITARELLAKARDRNQRVVPRPGLRGDKIVGCRLIVPVEGAVSVH